LAFRDVNELFLIGALLFEQVFYIRNRTEMISWQRLLVAFAKKALTCRSPSWMAQQ
jgi:hypothetical protein